MMVAAPAVLRRPDLPGQPRRKLRGTARCAALFGLAGNSFTVGIAWNSAWFPDRAEGDRARACSAPGTSARPGRSCSSCWSRRVLTPVPAAGYLGGLDPRRLAVRPGALRRAPGAHGRRRVARLPRRPTTARAAAGRWREMLAPLKHVRVWRFSLYYVVVFGAYVALSAWLPNYYRNTLRRATSAPRRLLTRPVHLPGQPAAAARRLAVGPVRPAGGHLRRVRRHDAALGAALPADDVLDLGVGVVHAP